MGETLTLLSNIDLNIIYKFAKKHSLTKQAILLTVLFSENPSFSFSVSPIIKNFIPPRMNTMNQRSPSEAVSDSRAAVHPSTKPNL